MIFSGLMGCSLNINKWHNPYFQWQNSEHQRESLQSPLPLGTQTTYHQILYILSTKSDGFSLRSVIFQCGFQTSNVDISRELVGNANPQVPTQNY